MRAVETSSAHGNYIGGRWEPSGGGRTHTTVNPARPSEIVGTFQQSTPDDVDRAMEAAAQSQREWGALPPPRRGAVLLEAWRLLREQADDLAATLTRETGKTITDARGEVKRALNVLEFVAGAGRRLTGETIPSELPHNFIYTRRRPLGVVALITPWNFPVAIPLWKIAPALVCGNAVVLKPATTTPLCAIRIAELLSSAGLPPGVLNVVTGAGSMLGDCLIGHPRVRAVSFTGSTDVGSRIYGAASAAMRRVQCEMGGKNALVVLPDADLGLAADAVVQGAYGFCGQRCTATSRVIVHEMVHDAFLRTLVDRVRALRIGDPMDPAVDLGPVASESQLRKAMEYVEIGQQEGARLVAGGGRADVPQAPGGYFVQPTIFDAVQPQMRLAQEEIFGPVLSLLTCRDLDHALALVNNSEYGFKASVYTKNIFDAMRFADSVDVAMVHINAPTLGGEVQAPFGGRKRSGAGMKEQGDAAIEFFSEELVVYIDYTGTGRDAKFL